MSRILFVTYEFHPTTWGGCGVLLRHATDLLLSQGHEVVLLFDAPRLYFERFLERDHETLSVPANCRAYHADALCEDLPWLPGEISNPFIQKSIRFAHALEKLSRLDPVDFVEFFEYCGVAYYALVEKRFGLRPARPVIGQRVHNSVELIDLHEGTKPVDRDRALLYGLEHAAMAHAESILLPSESYAERYYLGRYEIPDDAYEISEPPTARFGKRAEKPLEERREIQFFGRIFEFKGVERFVRAGLLVLEAIPDLEIDFVLIGNDSHDGPNGSSYTEYLRGTIPERFRERFVFTGHLDHETVVDRFADALFAVFPNQFESFCYAMHEAYESGLPLLVSDIPAFRNYLDEGHQAFYFDGSSVDLAEKIVRLVRDPSLLDGLQCGGPLANEPLGHYYDAPIPLRPILVADGDPLGLTAVVIASEQSTDAHLHRTLDAIGPQLRADDAVVLAYSADDARAAPAATAVRWLGATRRMQSTDGKPLSLGTLRTRDLLWVLVAGDEPDADFVELCRGTLERNADVSFAGTWHRDSAGRLLDGTLDIASERYPFEQGGRMTRCLIRTPKDELLVEAFSAQAGRYGEIGALWRAEETWGRGCLLPRAKLITSEVEEPVRDSGQLAYLVQSVATAERRARLSLVALSADGSTTIEPTATAGAVGGPPGVREGTAARMEPVRAARVAHDYLDGTTLARMAARKLRRKLVAALRRRKP